MKSIAPILIICLLAGCELFGPSTGEVRLEPGRSSYTVGDTVRVRLTNTLPDTLDLPEVACVPMASLERRDERGWMPVRGPYDGPCPAIVYRARVLPGSDFVLYQLTKWWDDASAPPGTYRASTVVRTGHREWTVVSPAFELKPR